MRRRNFLAPSGSEALPPAKEKDSATTGVLLSSTSQALIPSGVVTSLMSIAAAAVVPNQRAASAVIATRNALI